MAKMWKTIKEYVTTCGICSHSKVLCHHPYRLLRSLPIPKKPWFSISMDFIIDLQSSKDFDSIFVVVDRLIKMTHFMPCTKTITCEEIMRLIMDNIYKYHGLPDNIISNHGIHFTSKFWQLLFKILKVKIKLSSAYHPQLDGQIGRVNQVLKQYLCCTINYHKDDWAELLPLAEFAYNTTIEESTQQTPFFANYGYHPKFDQFNFNKMEIQLPETLLLNCLIFIRR